MTTESLLSAAAPAAAPAPAPAAAPAAAPAVAAPAAAAPAVAGAPAAAPAADAAAAPAADAAAAPAAAPAAPAGAPEKYEFKAAADATVDPVLATEVGAVAKELNLPQEQAQKVFDTAAKLAAKGIEAQHAAISTVQTQWDTESAAAGYTGETLAKAAAALKATSSPELVVLLEKSGLYRNPHVIKHFLDIAPAFAEGKHVPGGTRPAGGSKSAEQVLYPTAA